MPRFYNNTDIIEKLFQRSISIRINREDFKGWIYGRISRIFDDKSFLIPELKEDEEFMAFFVKLNEPLYLIPYPPLSKKTFHHAIILTWDIEELLDIIEGKEHSLQGGFQLILFPEEDLESRGISLERDAINIKDSYGTITKEIDIKLNDL